MPDLSFQIEGAETVPYSAAPLLALKLRVGATGVAIHSLMLRCQIRIEPARRKYDRDSQDRLHDLFGLPKEWGRTLRPLLWTHAAMSVPGFTGSTLVDVPVPCSFDFTAGATKYFDALSDGDVPLSLLFSGTLFYEADGGDVQVAQIPWDKEATYRLPIRIWRDTMNLYYPNSAWLNLRKDVIDRLARYRGRGAFASWEETLLSLLPPTERGTP